MASRYKLPNGETVFNHNGRIVNAGQDGWLRPIDTAMEKAMILSGALPAGAVTSEDALGNPNPLQIPRDGGLGGGAGSSTLAALTDIGSYDIGSNNPSVTAIKNTANAALPAAQKGAASGVAPLDSGGKVPVANLPAAVLGALNYQGTYNATTNSPAIVAGNKGFYWKVATAGTSLGYTWNVGDLVVDNGASIDKIDGIASEVVTVAGLTGVITSASLKTALAVASTDITDFGTSVTTPLAGKAAKAQTALAISFNHASPSDGDIVIPCVFGLTVTSVTAQCDSGSTTITPKVNTTAMTGTAVSVTGTKSSQAYSANNVLSAGDDLRFTLSSTSSCVNLRVTATYSRTLA